MKKLISGAVVIAAALAVASSANAADMARPVYKAPVIAPVYNWTGFYVGGNAGWYDFDSNQTAMPANAATSAFWGPCFAAGACPQNYGGQSGNGFIGGLQVGYNWQAANFVFGVEADWSWMSKSGDASFSRSAGNGFAAFVGTATTDPDWVGTVRGRAGLLFNPNLLGYVTGGWAYGQVNRTFTASFANGDGWSGSNKDRLNGWTLGGGVEWAVGNGWSIGAEYLYIKLNGDDYASSTSIGSGGCAGANFNRCNFTVHGDDVTQNVVRAKLNYKFDWGKSPVVAKY